MWAKVKNYKEAKLIAIMKREVSKGNWAYGVAFKENNQIIPFRTRHPGGIDNLEIIFIIKMEIKKPDNRSNPR